MAFDNRTIDKHGAAEDHHFDKEPDTCPICLRGMKPGLMNGFVGVLIKTQMTTEVQLVYRCPFEDCARAFFALYSRYNTGGRDSPFKLILCYPQTFRRATFSQEIKDVAPLFETIYNQAAKAESDHLDLIAGPGYRKALEFLIKDYASSKNPTLTADIKKDHLSPCIKKYISDPRINQCAEFAAWIGNDETHYERRWTDKDVDDLKRLIQMTVHWIEVDLETEAYLKSKANPPPP